MKCITPISSSSTQLQRVYYLCNISDLTRGMAFLYVRQRICLLQELKDGESRLLRLHAAQT